MKIYGYTEPVEISAAEPNLGASGPSVSLAKANQATLPSLPLASSLPRETLGDSGTRMLHGIITEEYNSQLQGIDGIKVYDEMRKSDGTVGAVLRALKLPIRRAKWFVNPATDDPKDKEIAEFVEHALFDWLENMTWDEFISQALLHLDFGVMLFEKVYGIKNHDGKDWVTLVKLAPRLPKSILKWELNDRTFGIQQIRQDGILAMIPGTKMLIFVNDREGDNWWGTSVLRPAYRHWYYKNSFYKIDAIAFERQGLGIPKITMPASYTEAEEQKAKKIMRNMRANEAAYLLLPQGYEAEFMDMGAGTTRDPSPSINHHDSKILLACLAQFLELGSKSTGSHALSSDHSELFLKGEEAVANVIGDVVNRQLIPELVDLNFDDVTVYPVLDNAGIKKEDVAGLGTAYSQLVTAGALHPTNDDEQYLRAALGLPPRSQEDMEAAAEGEPTTEEMQDNADIEQAPDDTEEEAAEVDQAANDAKKQQPTAADNKKTDQAAENAKPAPEKPKKPAPKKPTPKKKAHDHKTLPRTFDDGKGFMSWRPLSFAEQKVGWKSIQDKWNELEASFSASAKAMIQARKDRFMEDLHQALKDGDSDTVNALELDFANEYKAMIKQTMKAAYAYARSNASAEMGVATPPEDPDTLAAIDLIAKTVADKAVANIEASAKLAAANALKQGRNALQSAGTIDSNLEDAIAKTVDATAGIIVAQAINSGRADVFDQYADKIHALQRSEILDDKTCNFCLSMDGLVVATDDAWAATDTFHDWCRGIWVEILKDEENPPDITGVPKEIGDNYGGQPNDLTQPKNPIVKPGSLAAEEVARRKNAAAKK